MRAGSGLASSQHPSAMLAESAVLRAMQAAGLAQAGCLFLFMTRDMSPFIREALRAAARIASCLQVHGCTAYGVFTEAGWVLEQSGVAALVLEDALENSRGDTPILSLKTGNNLPQSWQTGAPRFGLIDSESSIWKNGRIAERAEAEISIGHLESHSSVVTGLRPLTEILTVESAAGHQLQSVDGKSAVESLLRALPPNLRDRPPLHRIAAVRATGEPGIPILSSNADGSLTLASCFLPGEPLIWCMRQALPTEKAMREAMAVAVNAMPAPDFALMFSCIGRGPLFYGEDDLDLAAVREHYPNLPLAGAYGSAQIACLNDKNLFYQNTVTTLFLKARHV